MAKKIGLIVFLLIFGGGFVAALAVVSTGMNMFVETGEWYFLLLFAGYALIPFSIPLFDRLGEMLS